MSIRDFPESLTQAMLVGTMLVGRLGVAKIPLKGGLGVTSEALLAGIPIITSGSLLLLMIIIIIIIIMIIMIIITMVIIITMIIMIII